MEYYLQLRKISDPLLKFINYIQNAEGINSQKMDPQRLCFFMGFSRLLRYFKQPSRSDSVQISSHARAHRTRPSQATLYRIN